MTAPGLLQERLTDFMHRFSKMPSIPSVSIAMCTFNGAAFLQFQLDSILHQTTRPDELVVCDDRSTDTTIVVLEAFQKVAPFPVRIFRNEETLRPAQNFAKCISLCGGEVILLCDQDDIWFPDRVAQTRGAFARDADIAFVYSDASLIDGEGHTLDRTLYSSLPIRPDDNRLLQSGGNLLRVLRRYNVLCGATMAFRAELKPMILPIPALWMHDEWIGMVGSVMGKAGRLPMPVTQYRQHAQQQLGTGQWSTGARVRIARERRNAFYQNEVQRLTHGLHAMAAHPQCAGLLPVLEARRRYFQGRLKVQQRGLRALPVLCRLLLAGGYRRYGSGLRSAMKDLSVAFGPRTAEAASATGG